MPHRPRVVLLHGFTHTGASWRPVVEALSASHEALTPDVRGHGSASERLPVDLSGVLEDLAALQPGEFQLAGYSMGGRLALHAALAGPHRVRRLVLIGASPGLESAGEREARRRADEQLARELESSRLEDFAARWATTPVLSGLPAEAAEAAHQDRLRNTPAGLAAALRGLGTGALPSLWGRLGELPMPVTLVVGERDQKFQQIARAMAERIPQGDVVVIPGAGHAVHLEAPEAIAEIIVAASGAHPR